MGVVVALASAIRRPLLLCVLAVLPGLAVAQATDLKFGVGTFTNETDGSDENKSSGDALAEFLQTDLHQLLQDGQDFAWCPGHLVEVRRKQDILDEQNFQQTKYVDKSTAIKPEDMGVPDPDLLIEGDVRVVLGQAHWTVHVRETPGGPDLLTYEGSDPADQLLQVSGQLAHNILNDHCPIPYIVTGGGPQIVVTGTVVRLDRPFGVEGKFPGGTAIFSYYPASDRGGTVDYTLSGGGFTGSGSGTYSVTDGADGVKLITQTTNGCMDGIPNSCKENAEKLTLTPVRITKG